MENFIKSVHPSFLAVIVIGIGIAFFWVANPPHTICDTQLEVLKESQKGSIFPIQLVIQKQKQRIPAKVVQAKESCQVGNSAGSCNEYFSDLRSLAVDIGKASSQCAPSMFEIPEVQRVLTDGIEIMTRIAWGAQPPEPGIARFNWFQESEMAIFCRVKNIYIRGVGEEAWENLRRAIFAKLPGEPALPSADPAQTVTPPRRAVQLMSEQDIWNRSLFSLRCESYR